MIPSTNPRPNVYNTCTKTNGENPLNKFSKCIDENIKLEKRILKRLLRL